MEVDQSASITSSLSSDLDDEDNNSLTKNTIENMEQDKDDELKTQIDTPPFTLKESGASCDDFEESKNKNINNYYELTDDFKTEKPPLQDSSQVTSTSSVYRENQKEDINHEGSGVKNCVEPSPDTTLESGESIEESMSVLESCTENDLISNVDSCNVNNVINNSTSNVDTYLVPCDQSSSSSSVGNNPMYSSENKSSGVCTDSQPVCRTNRRGEDEEVSSKRTNNCLSEGNFEEHRNFANANDSAVVIDNLNKGQTEETMNCANEVDFHINNANTEKTSDIIKSNESIDSVNVSNSVEESKIEADERQWARTVEMNQEFSSLEHSTIVLANSIIDNDLIHKSKLEELGEKNNERVGEENEDLEDNSNHSNESCANESEDINLINKGKAEENKNIKENDRHEEGSYDNNPDFSISDDSSNHSNQSFANVKKSINLNSKVDSEDIGDFERNFSHREENVERNQEFSNLKDYCSNKNVSTNKETFEDESNSTQEINFEQIAYSDSYPKPIDNYDHYSIAADNDQNLSVEKMYRKKNNSVVENLHIATDSKSPPKDSELKEDGVKKIQSSDFDTSSNKNLRLSDILNEKSDKLSHEQTTSDISEETNGGLGLINTSYKFGEPSEDSDTTTTNHTLDIKSKIVNTSSFLEKNNIDDHPKLNLNFVPDKISSSESPLGTDIEELTNDTKGENDKCDKLVDYAEDDSESDSLDSDEDGGSLRIVDYKENLIRDIDRTDNTSVQVKVDHSKEIEKSSINTYSEENFVDSISKLTANSDITHEKLGLSLNPTHIESKMLESSLSSSNSEVPVRNERPSLTDFDSSSSDEDELSRSIEKVLLDNENSQTSDSIEQNLNQQRIQLENCDESSIRETNEDKYGPLDSLKKSESRHFSSVVTLYNVENTSLENKESIDLERIKDSSANVDENLEQSRECMDVERTEENLVKSLSENDQQKILSPKENTHSDCEELQSYSVAKTLEQKLSSPTRNELTDFEKLLRNTHNKESISVSPKGSECTNLERVVENSVKNIAENVSLNKEISISTKFSKSHNSLHSLDIIKSIKEIIKESKTEENDISLKADFVTKINNIIKDKCDNIVNTSETISDIIRKIENIFKENELSNENHHSNDEEILERIEKIIFESSEDSKEISDTKQNNKDGQEKDFTSEDKEGSLTNLNHFADLEMGVFEESDEDSVDSIKTHEYVVNETSKLVPDHPSEEDSTDTADSDGEVEELSIQQSKQLSSKSLKRKQSMDFISNTQVPPTKKRALSFKKYMATKNKYMQCKKCTAVFEIKEVAKHFQICKGSLSNGVDISDGEPQLHHSVTDIVSKSTQSFTTFDSKPKSTISKSNTNFLTKNNAPSSLNFAKKSNSSTDLFTTNNSLSTANVSPMNSNLHAKNVAIPPFSQHVPILPKPNNFLELNRVSSVSKSPEPNKTVPRQVFLCAACQLYFEYWNLYLHMLEKHKRFICMYCLGMFGHSENLYTHLHKRHKVTCTYIPNSNSAVYKEYSSNKYILTCAACSLVLEDNDIDRHVCVAGLPSGSTLNKLLNSSLGQNSAIGSYPDPESFMLATMTEGEDKRPQAVEIITLDEASTVKAPEQEVSTQVTSPTTLPSVTSIMKTATGLSSSEKLTKTINEVAENRTEQKVATSENNFVPSDGIAKPLSPKATTPTKLSIPSFQDRASAALSELEKCHKMLIEDRTSDEETESDIEDSPMKLSILNCASKTPEKSFKKTIDLAKQSNRYSTSELSTSTDDDSDVKTQDDFLQKTKDCFFDAKVVLTKIDDPVESSPSSDDRSKTSAIISSQEDNKIHVNTSQHTSNESQPEAESSNESSSKEERSPLIISPEKDFSSQENEDDDDNRDLNDSDNENSLKIDDSVFEDDEEIDEDVPAEIAPEVSSLKPEESHEAEVDEEKKLNSSPAFKINPLRIKIKCGTNSGDNQYERVKTETEIREKEARERRYDEAIDEVIRKSIAEFEMKEAERERKEKERESREMEREQKEKDEYERLQAELAKKQEEYQRIQEAYLSLQMRSESQEDHAAEDESTELDESLEETGESHTENTGPDTDLRGRDERADADTEKAEKDNEERVKLIERRFQDEKSSLLKEELLKKCEKLFAGVDQLPEEEPEPSEVASVPLASEDIQPMALSLEEPLENTDIKIVIKECLRTSCSVCVHCYHATRIVANGRQLALHILAEHRYMPVKNDTGEDLIQFISSNLSKLDDTFFSSDTFDSEDKSCFAPFDNIYYCLQCSFASKHQRELTSHKRKAHPKTSQICLMCKQILLNQSELLFHYCAGVSNPNPADNTYWCGICGLDKIPSAFRLMVHLRKKHNTCNVCLESCANEGKLLQHMLKHKIIHMCYKCNISYRNKQDITKHLFWKHGTESIVCKRCLQKRWSHVYHFCQPPARFSCDECNLTFKSSSTLKVHKRIHAGVFPYECTEEGCAEKFVSKKLLEKHFEWHRAPPKPPTPPQDTDPNTGEPHIDVCNVDDSASLLGTLKPGGKSKKKKKSKFDLNNMNLPPLNLSSESDSSDDEAPSEAASTIADAEDDKTKMLAEADAASQDQSTNPDATSLSSELSEKSTPSETPVVEAATKPTEAPTQSDPSEEALSSVDMPDLTSVQPTPCPSESAATDSVPTEEDPPVAPTEIVPDVWDQFKSFTASLNVFRHVEEEHDYHVVYEEPPPPPPEPKPEDVVPSVEPSAPSQAFPVDDPVERKENEEESKAVASEQKSANSTLNKSTSGDSSSDSSSSSSCGSQCGSNCSCSSSSSSSSSSSDDSSSDSDSSDPETRRRQEEKRQAKKLRKRAKKHSHASEQNVTIENQPEEDPGSHAVGGETHVHVTPAEEQPPLLPPIAESDLETDVSSSDEDFYDEKPQASAPPALPPTPVSSSPHVAQSPLPQEQPPPYPSPIPAPSYPYASPQSYHPPPPAANNPRTPSRKRKRPRMRNVPSSSSTPKHASTFKTSFKHPFMRPSPAFEKKPPGALLAARNTPPGRSPGDDNTRSSKRKRKQNRFYGYSDDEEPGEYDQDESEEYAVRPPPFKKKLWRHPAADDRIPIPPASPPPYESKIRFENPLKLKIATDYATHHQMTRPAEEYQGDTTPEPAAAHSPSSSDEDPTMAQYNALAAMPPPPIVPEVGAVPLYCYCRCPYDEVSEMIACDGDDCEIEWYHFECVNILVPPKGKWYCPQCRPKYQPFGS